MNAQVKQPMDAKEINRTISERLNEIARIARDKETATARAQPHRREFGGDEDRALGTPLGRFCRRTWPEDPAFRAKMQNAGNDYAREVREATAARGHAVEGLESGSGGFGSDKVTQAAIDQAMERIVIADAALAASRRALMSVGYGMRTKEAIERLVCCDVESDLVPSVRPNDSGIVRAGLYKLAEHYGMIDHGINTGKDI